MNSLIGGLIGAGVLLFILRQIEQPQTVAEVIAQARSNGQSQPQPQPNTPLPTVPGGIDYIEPGTLPATPILLPTVRLIGGGYTYHSDIFRDPFRAQSSMELERDDWGNTGQQWI